MNALTEYYIHAELALAAYANLNSGMISELYIGELKIAGMSESQAKAFEKKWEVIDSFSDDTGISATVFKKVNDTTGQTHLAIRGTSGMLIGDIDDDMILAAGFPSYLNPQFLQLRLKVNEWLNDDTLSSGFTVSGHSIGGYLAAATGTWFSQDSSDIYTLNAPGVGGLTGNVVDVFRDVFGLSDTALVDGISNIRGTAGISLVSGIGAQLSPPIYIETESSLDPFSNHSIGTLTDSLAVYNLFAEITPALTIEDISGILQINSQSYMANFVLEKTITQIADILVPTVYYIPSGDREAFYSTIKDLQTQFKNQEIVINSLAGLLTTEIESAAKATGDSGFAARYALVNLNPFTITGESGLYNKFNVNGEIDLYSDTNKNGDLSGEYIEDRSKFLYYLSHPDATLPEGESTIIFTDKRLGITTIADKDGLGIDLKVRDYLWGTEGTDVFGSAGNTGDDTLFERALLYADYYAIATGRRNAA